MNKLKNYKAAKPNYTLLLQTIFLGITIGIVAALFIEPFAGILPLVVSTVAGFVLQISQNKQDKAKQLESYKAHLVDFKTMEIVNYMESTIADPKTKMIMKKFLYEYRNFQEPKMIKKDR